MNETFGNSGGEGGYFSSQKWKFRRSGGGGGVFVLIPSMVGVWILSATAQSTFVLYCPYSCFITQNSFNCFYLQMAILNPSVVSSPLP